jgi:hypothetical protein
LFERAFNALTEVLKHSLFNPPMKEKRPMAITGQQKGQAPAHNACRSTKGKKNDVRSALVRAAH